MSWYRLSLCVVTSISFALLAMDSGRPSSYLQLLPSEIRALVLLCAVSNVPTDEYEYYADEVKRLKKVPEFSMLYGKPEVIQALVELHYRHAAHGYILQHYTSIIKELDLTEGIAQWLEKVAPAQMLIDAVQEGSLPEVEHLLGQQVPVNVRTLFNLDTPLMAAIEKGNWPVVWLLLSRRDVDVNAQSVCGKTALYYAAEILKPRLVKHLLSMQALVNTKTVECRMTPLHAVFEASMHNPKRVSHALEIVTALLEAKADINAQTNGGQTPLMLAVKYGGLSDIVKVLIDKGADTTVKDIFGNDALSLVQDNDLENKALLAGTCVKL